MINFETLVLTCSRLCTHICADKPGLTCTCTQAALTLGRQCSRDQCNLLQLNPKPVSSSICPGSWTVYGCVKSVLHLFMHQTAAAICLVSQWHTEIWQCRISLQIKRTSMHRNCFLEAVVSFYKFHFVFIFKIQSRNWNNNLKKNQENALYLSIWSVIGCYSFYWINVHKIHIYIHFFVSVCVRACEMLMLIFCHKQIVFNFVSETDSFQLFDVNKSQEPITR